jgi:hypothetical protein
MARNCLTFSLDVEYQSVGRLIEDLRNREGIMAIHLVEEKQSLSSDDQKPARFKTKKPGQTFSAALLETLYTQGPQSRDGLQEILPHYNKHNAHFSQTLSYLRSTGRTVYGEKTGLWNLSKTYRNHVDKRLNRDVVMDGTTNAAIPLSSLISNGSTNIKSKMSGGDLILKLMASKQTPLHRSDIRTAFVKDGRSKSSVGDQLFKLVKAHKIKRVEKGTYELV